MPEGKYNPNPEPCVNVNDTLYKPRQHSLRSMNHLSPEACDDVYGMAYPYLTVHSFLKQLHNTHNDNQHVAELSFLFQMRKVLPIQKPPKNVI